MSTTYKVLVVLIYQEKKIHRKRQASYNENMFFLTNIYSTSFLMP